MHMPILGKQSLNRKPSSSMLLLSSSGPEENPLLLQVSSTRCHASSLIGQKRIWTICGFFAPLEATCNIGKDYEATLDYFWVSPNLAEVLSKAEVAAHVPITPHCAVTVDMHLKAVEQVADVWKQVPSGSPCARVRPQGGAA